MIDGKKLAEIVTECIREKSNTSVTIREVSIAIAKISAFDPSTEEIEKAKEDLTKRMNEITEAIQ